MNKKRWPRRGNTDAAQQSLFAPQSPTPPTRIQGADRINHVAPELPPPGVPDAEQAAEGERRKDAALAKLEARNPPRTRAAQVVMVRVLLERGECTINDVRRALGLSDGDNTRWLGSVSGGLAKAKVIERAGFVATYRAVANGHTVSVWRLRDGTGAAARAWLAANGAAIEELGGGADGSPRGAAGVR